MFRKGISPCEGLDCNDLLRVNCKITKCGIGGPMINLNGEVVGINFYSENFTPFLPINVVTNWWNQAKGGRCLATSVGILEAFFFIELKQHQLHQEVLRMMNGSSSDEAGFEDINFCNTYSDNITIF
ncbi:hypothetical protein OROGR_017425 [Orobanche gracilis]